MTDIPAGLTDIPSNVPGDAMREHGAALVRNGLMSLDDANAKLSARGAAPLNANAIDLAQAEHDRLMKDPEVTTDPAKWARLTALGARIAQGGGALTDKPMTPADYNFPAVVYRSDVLLPMPHAEYHDDLADLASALQMNEANAKTLVDEHLNAVKREAEMSSEGRDLWGQKQERDLFAALGDDAETRLKAASASLKQTTGRNLDLLKIVKTNGCMLAMQLLFQAEHLERQRRAR